MSEVIDMVNKFCQHFPDDNTPIDELLLKKEYWTNLNIILEQFQITITHCKLFLMH